MAGAITRRAGREFAAGIGSSPLTALLALCLAAPPRRGSPSRTCSRPGCPSLCGFPAGNLVDGALPGTDPGHLNLKGDHYTALGRLGTGKGDWTAATI